MALRGKFIVLEGIDGSGLSTQACLLQNWLHENEQVFGKTYFTKEPTDGPVGSLIRLALAKRLKPMDERVMALLFAADRIDHLYCKGEDEQREGIAALLQKGYNVVSDRYYLSSYAYQSLACDLEWLQLLNADSIKPDLTILLQVPIQESAQRRDKSRLQEELYEKRDHLLKISRNYEEIAQKLKTSGENIVMINGNRDKNAVFTDITNAVKTLFA